MIGRFRKEIWGRFEEFLMNHKVLKTKEWVPYYVLCDEFANIYGNKIRNKGLHIYLSRLAKQYNMEKKIIGGVTSYRWAS